MNFPILHNREDDLKPHEGGEDDYGTILVDYHCGSLDWDWPAENGCYEKVQR